MKNKLQRFYQLVISNYSLLFIYILCLSYVASQHEVWRDEADSWLVARDISAAGLFQFTRNSGHPSLWYWVLIPFAKLGFPYYTLTIIHVIIASGTAYLLLFHSTFKKYLVVLLIFGYYFFFEYAVIARNYALSNFLLFLVAAIYRKRFQKPILFGIILFLLANTNIYATIITSGIGLLYLIEIVEQKKYDSKTLFGLSLIILGGIVCIIQLVPSEERQSSPTNTGIFFVVNSTAFLLAMAHSYAPGVMNMRALISLVILPISLFYFYNTKKVFIFFVWVTFTLSMFFTFVYMGGHRHAGFLLITLVFSVWIKSYYDYEIKSETIYESLFSYLFSFVKEPEKIFKIALLVTLIFSFRFSFQESKKEILYSYSNAKEMSEFIKSNGYDNNEYLIATHNLDRGKTILYFLTNIKTFYYPALDSFGSHMWWDKEMSKAIKLKSEDMFSKTREKYLGKSNILFLSDTELKATKDQQELLYKTKRRNEFIRDEEFYLYLIK